METQATPTQGTEQAATVENRLVNFLQAEEPEQPETTPEAVEPAVPAEGQAQELSPDDIPDEQAPKEQPNGETFEFEAAGEHLKVSRDEVIKLAQQGHDYTRKTMALADQAKTVNERLSRVSAIEQVHPQLQQSYAQVQALGAQLQRFNGVDWVALATNDPMEYTKVQAQYHTLNNSYQMAANQFGQLKSSVEQQAKAIQQDLLRAESQKLTERNPQWKDPEKFRKDSQELRAYLLSEGATDVEVDGLNTAVAVSIAWKAKRYDDLVKAKAGKVKLLQSAPPVTRPGATPSTGAARADQDNELRGRLRKSGRLEDAAALLMTRMN